MGVLDKITTIEDTPLTVNMGLYGPSGVGKTTFAATAPKPFFIDVERGTLSLRNNPAFAKIPRLRPDSYKDVEELVWILREGTDPICDKIETIIIDPISELQKLKLTELIKFAAAKDQNRNPYQATLFDYGINTEVMRRLLIALRDLERYNLIVIAHDTEEKDEDTGAILRRPDVTAKVAGTLLGIMDVVGYMTSQTERETLETTRFVQVWPSRIIKAKTRIGGLPPILENPEFSDFMKAMTQMSVTTSEGEETNE